MSETQPSRQAGPGRGRRAAAGVVGAVACVGIGWAIGVRTADAHIAQTTNQPVQRSDPDGSVTDPGSQWGTITDPGSSLAPAVPGNGGVVPPNTGTGGSSIGGTG
ncbi:MAG TPA: hypothetical protein VK646_13000 [Actinomycetota bacterium]|nr:hypothetical protein [Actinomycetota bacterium]